MKRVRAPKVRNSLGAIINGLPSDGLTTEKIIAALRKDHAVAIAADTNDLVEIALVRLVDQVGALRTKSTAHFDPVLFEEYAVQPRLNLTIETPDGSKKVWKNLDDVSVGEARRYVAQHERSPVRISPTASELHRLLNDVRDFVRSEHEKLVIAWRAAKDARP
jgi:hypothetical protein